MLWVQHILLAAGGASLSFHSLTAATLGAAACVPLLMLRAYMWSHEARAKFPVLEDLQKGQAEEYSAVLTNTTAAQVHSSYSGSVQT